MIPQKLIQYIENEVIPQYASFDKAHREDHARSVIERALSMARGMDGIREDMLYTAAACHDLGFPSAAKHITWRAAASSGPIKSSGNGSPPKR